MKHLYWPDEFLNLYLCSLDTKIYHQIPFWINGWHWRLKTSKLIFKALLLVCSCSLGQNLYDWLLFSFISISQWLNIRWCWRRKLRINIWNISTVFKKNFLYLCSSMEIYFTQILFQITNILKLMALIPETNIWNLIKIRQLEYI